MGNEAMRYFGIKTPDGMIWWIETDEHKCWHEFFTHPARDLLPFPHRLPMQEAIRAYKGLGYRCVELEVREVNRNPT
jgi:hypothetical protein